FTVYVITRSWSSLFFCGDVDPWDLHSFPTRRSSDLGYRAHFGVSTLVELTTQRRHRRRCASYPASDYPQLGLHGANDTHDSLGRSEEHTSELQSRFDLVCRLLLEKKNTSQHEGCQCV